MPNTGNGRNHSSFFPVFIPLFPSILTAAVKNWLPCVVHYPKFWSPFNHTGFCAQKAAEYQSRKLKGEDSSHTLVLQLKKKKLDPYTHRKRSWKLFSCVLYHFSNSMYQWKNHRSLYICLFHCSWADLIMQAQVLRSSNFSVNFI